MVRQVVVALCVLLSFFSAAHSFVSTSCQNKFKCWRSAGIILTALSAADDDSNDIDQLFLPRNGSTCALVSRRSFITWSDATLSALFFYPHVTTSSASAAADIIAAQTITRPSITIPLQFEPKLSSYTVFYVVGGTKFGAIVDTGSPFLVVPQTSCMPDYKWGCYRPDESHPAPGLDPTYERFVGNEGLVEWREGRFSFPDSISSVSNFALLFPQSSSMTFGVVSESLLDGTGGLFLGLVKETNSWIRPSFLGQSDVQAFSVDLREREGYEKSLTLYGGRQPSLLVESAYSNNAIQLVRDLNKNYGDATIHYVGVASSLNVNGYNLASSSRRNKIYVIFDTGCSGMSISTSLFNKRYSIARERRENNLWGNVDVEFNTISGGEVSLSAKRPITTTLDDQPWGKKLDGYLVVLGLAFLDGRKMTVDIENEKIWFD